MARSVSRNLNTSFDGIRLEICLLIDATASMVAAAPRAKEFAEALYSRMRSVKDLAGVRIAIVAYRDFSDGAERIETLPFTDSKDAALAFLTGLTAKGGADVAEDVRGGLEAALALEWHVGKDATQDSKYTKVIVHIGDAPAHGAAYHDLGEAGDSHLARGADQPSLESLVSRASLESIDYVFVTVNDSDKSLEKMLGVMQDAYNRPAPGEVPKRLNFQRASVNERDMRGLAATLIGVVNSSTAFSSKTIDNGRVKERPAEDDAAWKAFGSKGVIGTTSSSPKGETKWAAPPPSMSGAAGGASGSSATSAATGGVSLSKTVAAPSADVLIENLSPGAVRKLKALGAVDASDKPTGKNPKLTAADEDELAEKGVNLGLLKALAKFGVIQRAD
jgi:hypothetical protein